MVPGNEGTHNVTFAFADELANQGFPAITKWGRHILINLYIRIAKNKSELYKSSPSSISTLLMDTANQFVTVRPTGKATHLFLSLIQAPSNIQKQAH